MYFQMFRCTFKDFEQSFMISILSGCFECSKNEPNDDCEIYYKSNIKANSKITKTEKNEQIERLKIKV